MLFSFSTVCFLCVYCNKYSQFCQPQGGTILEFCQSLLVYMRPVRGRSGRTWFSFFRTLVAVQHVGDEILVHVHVVVHGNCCKSRITQNPADFTDLRSLIRQAFFHLVRDYLWVVTHNFFLLIVSHAPIISDRWRLVKPNQGFPCFLCILSAFFTPCRHLFSNFLKVVVSRYHIRSYVVGTPAPHVFVNP